MFKSYAYTLALEQRIGEDSIRQLTFSWYKKVRVHYRPKKQFLKATLIDFHGEKKIIYYPNIISCKKIRKKTFSRKRQFNY